MKTLDEVIIALEVCTSAYCSHPKYGDCPYIDERNDCDTRQRKLDALHYLKEYRAEKNDLERTKKMCFEFVGSKMIEAEKRGMTIRCQNCGDEFIILPESNEPLDWETLKQMEGKPVWIEYDDHFSGRKRTYFKVWEVINYVSDDRFITNSDCDFHKNEMGDVWQAYRKERS